MNYQIQTPVTRWFDGFRNGSTFSIPVCPQPLSLSDARAALPPEEFRQLLRQHLIDHPDLTLRDVAQELGVTRQRVGMMVGKLDRPTCAEVDRPAPKKEAAALGMAELRARVAAGESAERATSELGLSLSMAMHLGFRAKEVRPPHGTLEKARTGCGCWRCRRAAGLALPRAGRVGERERATVLDWLAWVNPETGRGLSQTEIGRLVGIGQGAVSRIALASRGRVVIPPQPSPPVPMIGQTRQKSSKGESDTRSG
jgi:predicted transcriptional regulator